MIWSDAQVTRLHHLWREIDDAGKPLFSREQIAEALGIGAKAVIGKLGREYRNGRLEPRVNNSTNGGRRGGEKALRAAKVAADKSRAIRLVKPLSPLPPATTLPITRPHQCQWPMWKHGDRSPAPPLFCGAGVLHGHAYCPEHCRRAFHNWHELTRVAAMALRHVQDSIGRPF